MIYVPRIIERNKPKKDFKSCLSIISIILLHGDLNKLRIRV